LRLETRDVAHWPPLGWLALCDRSRDEVLVRHGPGVEAGDGFACEATWPGRFEDGGFDRAAIVAGSGVRVRGGEAVFVSATSTTDRLYSVERSEGPVVSNSLPCVLRAVGAHARLDYWLYQTDLQTIIRGLDHFRPLLPTTGPPVRLTYFRNMVWDGEQLYERDKPLEPEGFAGFEDHRAFLAAGLQGIAANMRSDGRRRRYEMLGTLSSGYDGAAVTALAAETGCRQALCFDQSRLEEPDSGEPIARALGIEPIVMKRAAWREEARRFDRLYEAPFFAAMPTGNLTPFAAAAGHLADRILITGFHGDWIWNPNPPNDRLLARSDFSGITLTEFRLGTGFLNCGPAFWGARQLADVMAISRSEEMRPWVVGRTYQRPIARRIVEEAGVPRGTFGVRKQPGVGGSLVRERAFLGPDSLGDYRAWTRHEAGSLSGHRLLALAAIDLLGRPAGALAGAVLRAGRSRAGGRPGSVGHALYRRIEPSANRLRRAEWGLASRTFTFQWALDRVGDRYAKPW
jgi:hypothetical protein